MEMFRTMGSCERYEHISIQLDTPVVLPANGVRQQKNGYQFTLNDRSSYFDWYNAYFEVDFNVNKLAAGDNYGNDARIAMINDVASLITELQVKQNEKMIYDGNNLYRITNIKNLLKMSQDYATSSETKEYFYLDTTDTTVIGLAGKLNKGFEKRHILIVGGTIRNVIIPLNKFAFFEGLERNLLPPSQIQINLQLTDDNTLIYRHVDVDEGRVVVQKLVLWVPRMVFNPDGLNYVLTHHSKAQWTYLREMVQESQSSTQRETTFNITAGVKNPKHIFIYIQRTNKSSNQEHNPHILDTFKVNPDNDNCSLSSARLEVGNGVYYPELEYSNSNIARIFRDVINYDHKQNNKDTGSLLTRLNFIDLFGLLYFNLTYQSDTITADPRQIILRYKLNAEPDEAYKVFAIILYEEEVKVDIVGNETIII